MTTFDDVVKKWQEAPVTAIHPLRETSEWEYWQSGVAQAEDMVEWLPKGGTVVDFGCGDGRIALPLSLMGFHVIAVDASVGMLKRARANEKERGGMVMSYILSNGLDLANLIEQPVDLMMSRAVLIHHSHGDGAALVESLAVCIKSGGYFAADWPTGDKHTRRDWIDVTIWNPAERERMAKSAGLSFVQDGPPSVWQKVV